jgi:hypothetical protein
MNGTDKRACATTDHAHANFLHSELPSRLTGNIYGLLFFYFQHMVIQGSKK